MLCPLMAGSGEGRRERREGVGWGCGETEGGKEGGERQTEREREREKHSVVSSSKGTNLIMRVSPS